MNYSELRKLREEKLSELFKTCGVFFAFSNSQFEENKTELAEGDKYVRLGAGGFIPKSKADLYLSTSKENHNWFREQIKIHNLKDAEILYELQNHECFYTGEIDQAIEALGVYSYDEVRKVYLSNLNLQD